MRRDGHDRRIGPAARMLASALALVVSAAWQSAAADEALRAVFRDPPAEAKPRGYWVWPHGNFDVATIRGELAGFKAQGLGGVDIFDLGVRDPDDVIPPGPGFLSPAQVDGIAVALDEAKNLGLAMGLIVASSWNAGGSWTSPEDAAMNLVAWREEVTGPKRIERDLPLPEVPDSFQKPYGKYPLHVPRDAAGNPLYLREVALLAAPLDAEGRVADPAGVLLLTDRMDANGRLVCDLPAGRWLLLRAVLANFGQRLWLPSDNSQGLAIDHFSAAAVKHHFETVMDRLEARTGPLRDTALERLYLASYESNADVIWSPELAAEFARRNGYRIEPWIPALFGVTVRDAESTERFRYDYRLTVSEMFLDNLYRQARTLCHDRGLLLCSEAGGPGAPLHDVPTEDLAALGSVDVMRGEFWHGKTKQLTPEGFEELQVVKPIASAAHIYGHRVVEMESFTCSTSFDTGIDIFRPLADRAFCEGMTRVVYHTMTHNLPGAGLPGWTFQAGTHVSTAQTWWPLSAPLHAYFARCGALLMQGRFVADVAWYYGHAIPNFAKPKHPRPGLGQGYDYDDLNTEILLQATVDPDGRIALPSGMTYAVLALPTDDRRMDLAVAKHLEKLVRAGGTVVGPRPERTYGLRGHPEEQRELLAIAELLWGGGPAGPAAKGRVIGDATPREVLEARGIGPDVDVFPAAARDRLDFIHRRTESADLYMVRNASAEPLACEVTFRVRGMVPEIWDAVRATTMQLASFVEDRGGTRVALRLDGQSSQFVVFTRPDRPAPHVVAIARDGAAVFPWAAEPATVLCTRGADGAVRLRSDRPGDHELRFSDGTSRTVRVAADPAVLAIAGPWEVRFPEGEGLPGRQRLAALASWTESTDPAVRAFSGIATSATTFEMPAEAAARSEIVLDLGEVGEVARVVLNGREAGTSMFAPHRLDVTGLVRPGSNTLEVEVANTWLNRLAADEALPREEQRTRTNLRGPGGGRRWRDLAPRPSGLMGPVRLEFPRTVIIAATPEPRP